MCKLRHKLGNAKSREAIRFTWQNEPLYNCKFYGINLIVAVYFFCLFNFHIFCLESNSYYQHLVAARPLTSQDQMCQVCHKTFPDLSQLKTHGHVHSGFKPFDCNVCGKSFSQSSSLKPHKWTRTVEQLFPCTSCYKTLSQSSHLKTNKTTYTGGTPYSSSKYTKSFSG